MEQIPLSFNQQFMCQFDRGDEEGAFGPHNHIVHGWRIRGEVDVDTMRAALTDVVARHEALRTEIVRDAEPSYQRVLPPSPVVLDTRDMSHVDQADRDDIVDRLITEVESSTISIRELPLIRGLLARFEQGDHLLVLTVHHMAADGFSVRVISRDVVHRYAALRGFDVGELPPTRPYREYAVRQQASHASPALDPSRRYWRETLRGGRILALPTDIPKSAGLPESTSVFRFLIDTEVAEAVLKVARAHRCTPFMVLLAGFMRLVHQMSGTTDVVVPTFTPGRGDEDFQDTVGLFFNFLPIRSQLSEYRNFGELVNGIRANCLEAYSHDIAQILDEAPHLMEPVLEDDRAACVFQVFPFPLLLDGSMIGDLAYTEVRRRVRSQPVGGDVPNGALWTLNFDPAGDIVVAVNFNRNLFHEGTISAMAADYVSILRQSVADSSAPLTW